MQCESPGDDTPYADARLGTLQAGQTAQSCAVRAGTELGYESLAMVNVFSAGQELVRWEVTAISDEGPYRLGVYHAGGAIVEYFHSVPAALQRLGYDNIGTVEMLMACSPSMPAILDRTPGLSTTWKRR